MKLASKPLLLVGALAFATLVISVGVPFESFAQSTQKMDLLTPKERAEFSRRLQKSGISSERSKITAEMNKIVQQRRFELRRAEFKKKMGEKK